MTREEFLADPYVRKWLDISRDMAAGRISGYAHGQQLEKLPKEEQEKMSAANSLLFQVPPEWIKALKELP